MYKVLYRAYRPEVFSDMLGQEHIVKILENQIKAGTVNHAYLFCGTRGTGKTTVARLLAKAVNCTGSGEMIPCGECDSCRQIAAGNYIDLIEIDAASNNGVDEVRDLREGVEYPPVAGKKKVYIIDEVHMMSKPAFNALLKTLEEPPEFVMFILCTTEPEKLPATVLSRCMRMDFRRVPEELLADRVRKICIDRNIVMEETAVRLIVAAADGSARDCLTLLDQCISGRSGMVTREEVLDSLGTVGEDVYTELTEMVNDNDPASGLLMIDKLMKSGKDSRQILQGWMAHYRNLLMAKFIENPEDMISMSVENIERISGQAKRTDLSAINNAIIEIAKTINEASRSSQPRVLLEICMVKLATTTPDGRAVSINMKKAERKAAQREAEKAAQQAAEQTAMQERMPAAASVEAQQAEAQINTAPVNAAQAPERPVEPVYTNEPPIVREPVQQTDYTEDMYEDEIDAIWAEIIEDGESQTDTFTIVRTGAVPIKMNDTEFVIKTGGIARRYLEKNRIPMEQLIAKYAGGYHKMILRSEDEEQNEKTIEQVADKASQLLGTKVDIT